MLCLSRRAQPLTSYFFGCLALLVLHCEINLSEALQELHNILKAILACDVERRVAVLITLAYKGEGGMETPHEHDKRRWIKA